MHNKTMENIKVLLVDDDELVRQKLITDLKGLGITTPISDAAGGDEALEILKDRSPFDLIILDIEMPKMSGIELLKIIKREAIYKDVPTLMLTSKSNMSTVVEVISLGVKGYILKPWDNRSLKEKIEHAIGVK